MNKITLIIALIFSLHIAAQVTTVASTSFEDPQIFSGQYTDTGDASIAHDLMNNANEPIVNFVSTGGEIGFMSTYIPYDTPSSGLTDGDFVGVTNFTGTVGAYTDGVNGFQFSDTDGTMTAIFDTVDFSSFTNATIGLDYFVNTTGYEGDGTSNDSSNDLIHIYINDLTNNQIINVLDTAGSDINDLMIEGAWTSAMVNIPDGIMAQLVVSVRTNSSSEALYIDNIVFEGEPVVVVPELAITEIFPGQSGADLTSDWFEIENIGATPYVSAQDGALFYDDESADASTADLINGIDEIQPGERVIVLITDALSDVDEFMAVWGPVIDITDVQIGTTDGAGLGGGGDAVVLWLSDPSATMPIATGMYPDTNNNDGQSYDVELGAFSEAGNANNAVVTYANAGSSGNVPNIGSPGNGTPYETLEVQFDTSFISTSENASSITASVSISNVPLPLFDVSVEVNVRQGGTAVEGLDFMTPPSQTIVFSDDSAQEITFDILDNGIDNSDVFFVVELQNVTNAFVGENRLFSVYILDDDTEVPAGDDTVLDLGYDVSYQVDPDGTAEIVTYDFESQRLFVTNDTSIEVLDFSDPTNITSISSIDITVFGASVQSVAVSNGIVAAAVSAEEKTDNGVVVLTDINGANAVTLEVGALPDMLTFTPDGTRIIVANEGEPNDDYSIDPEGSVSIIDVTGGLSGTTQADVSSVLFTAFNGQEATLNANGIRIYGPNATVAQDLEPEYVAVSGGSDIAYVSFQENNAYAVIDIATASVLDIFSFGLKDHSLPENSLDVSDETDFIFNASWPIRGMYMPDAISFYSVGGVDYIVTANEGDAREYDTFEEERKIDDDDYILDPAIFSNTEILELETNLAEINVTNASGDIDGDGDFDEIHVFGGRSFSIFNAATGSLVFDSANDFEVITAADPVYGAIFNASNSNNNPKNRSDNKGPEPEGVLVQEINGSFYAFVLLERIGGVMVYDITNPNSPLFIDYVNNREATPGADEMGDLGPEGLVYVSEQESPNGTAYLLVANEVSATISIIALDNVVLGTQDNKVLDGDFKMYPNPAVAKVFFDTPNTYTLFTVMGVKISEVKDAKSIDLSGVSSGIYIVQNKEGNSKKLIVE